MTPFTLTHKWIIVLPDNPNGKVVTNVQTFFKSIAGSVGGTLDKRDLSERDICSKYITPALERAGWDRML